MRDDQRSHSCNPEYIPPAHVQTVFSCQHDFVQIKDIDAGDLWSGNVSGDEDGRPVLFDPAPYYGHHEADLGIARMFGGFTSGV